MLLPCNCNTPPCHSFARLKLDILCIIGAQTTNHQQYTLQIQITKNLFNIKGLGRIPPKRETPRKVGGITLFEVLISCLLILQKNCDSKSKLSNNLYVPILRKLQGLFITCYVIRKLFVPYCRENTNRQQQGCVAVCSICCSP